MTSFDQQNAPKTVETLTARLATLRRSRETHNAKAAELSLLEEVGEALAAASGLSGKVRVEGQFSPQKNTHHRTKSGTEGHATVYVACQEASDDAQQDTSAH